MIILEAALEVAGGALATVVSILLRTLGSYRKMTAQEIAEAKLVFGNTLDYDRIYFAAESLVNDIIFGIQDFFTKNPESRAFVTDTLVNFDVDEGIERHTMIHELTHVWQFEVTGPFYMSEAIHAQVARGGLQLRLRGGRPRGRDRGRLRRERRASSTTGKRPGSTASRTTGGRERELRDVQPRAAGTDHDALLRAQGAAERAARRVRRLEPYINVVRAA